MATLPQRRRRRTRDGRSWHLRVHRHLDFIVAALVVAATAVTARVAIEFVREATDATATVISSLS